MECEGGDGRGFEWAEEDEEEREGDMAIGGMMGRRMWV